MGGWGCLVMERWMEEEEREERNWHTNCFDWTESTRLAG